MLLAPEAINEPVSLKPTVKIYIEKNEVQDFAELDDRNMT